MTHQKDDIQKDIKILELMIVKIERFFDKKLYISDLIYDLESFLNQLITVDKKWKKDFRTLWLDIEIAYSLALDQGLEQLTDEGNAITESSLHALKKMTEDKIKELKT